jgi:predicted ester cyclase
MGAGRNFVDRWMKAYIDGDLDALASMCQPDVELANPYGVLRGPEGVRALFEPFIQAMSERDIEVTRVVESGDTVVALFYNCGRHTGTLALPQGPVPATGKSYRVSNIGIYELRDGKLAWTWGEFDRLTYMEQLGLVPAEAAR